MSATEKAGHTFLASLGKTRLRPGGVEATEWLFSQSQLTPGSQVLEVACNMATTAIELVQRYGCTVYAIDMDKTALSNAIEDERGKWLREAHSNSACEYSICGVLDGQIVNARIDRTFVDDQDTRWIVNYKSSLHEGAG